MAKKTTSAKPSSKGREPAEAVTDDNGPAEVDTPETDKSAASEGDRTEAEAATNGSESTDAETADAAPAADPEEAGADAAEPASDDDTPRMQAAPPPVTAGQVVIRKGGFVPLLLGGVLAGAIGLGAGYYLATGGLLPTAADIETLSAETSQGLQAQSDRLDTLSERLAATETPDLSGLEAGQARLRDALDGLTARVAAAEDRLDDLAGRVGTLAERSLTEGASAAAVAAFDAELKKLQQAMADQRAEIAAMTEDARAMESSAQETAQTTMRRAALSRVLTALDTGGGYADALADLRSAGASVPDILARSAPGGIATLSDLQARFPDAARAALAAARAAAVETGETGGATAFLRNVLGVRSLEPRAGDDPDAILSRAEAATREGRLTDALAEIDALPQIARTELGDWTADARARLDVIAAAQKLSEELN